MYTFQTKAEVTQISLTGARLIVILGALMTAPRDLQDLNSLISECGLVDKNYSNDTIRIALSTLKAAGCDISRPCKATNFKYKLLSHPFTLNITDEEINALKTLYANMTRGADYKLAVKFEELFNTLSGHVFNEKTSAELRSITSFCKIDKDVYDRILAEDGKNNILTITYATPVKKLGTKKFIFGRIFLKSNKLYVEGIDTEKKNTVCYNMTRIREIINIEQGHNEYKPEVYKLKYLLKNPDNHTLPQEAKVHKGQKNQAEVEIEFTSKFFAVQHILSLGADCTILEPEDIKNEVISKLMELRKVYA